MRTRDRTGYRLPIVAAGLCVVVGSAAGCGGQTSTALDPIVQLTTPGPARVGTTATDDSRYVADIGNDLRSLSAPFAAAENVCALGNDTNCATALVGAEAAIEKATTDLDHDPVPRSDTVIDSRLRSVVTQFGGAVDEALDGVLDQDILQVHLGLDQAATGLAAIQHLGDQLAPPTP
jgi:hypothetical protein